MSSTNSSLSTILLAAAVAAVVSAAGIGLYAANRPAEPPVTKAEAPAETVQSPSAFTDEQKQSIQTVVRDYLVKNPELLIEMSGELERRQAAAEEKARSEAIAANADALYRDDDLLVAGNPNGDVTIVEFSDYNCPYCRRAFGAVSKLIENDPNVRLVMKEFPIFGEQSIGAARVAIAAEKQGRYFDVHAALLRAQGRASEESALRIAEKLGLDIEKLKADMNSDDVKKEIIETRKLGEALGIQGTPFYLVGDKVVPGAPDNLYELFVDRVAEIRKSGCTVAC